MKIYLDVILLINLGFDFLLLLIVNLILKERARLYRVFLGSLLGSLSVFFLFIPPNSFTLFLLKVFTSVGMIWITFGKKRFWKNMLYLYFTSILLGGFLYFINLQVSYKNEGLLFFYNGFSLNLILLFLLSPIILYCYYKQSRYFKETLSNVHTVDLYYQGKTFSYTGYLDTGNKLFDPYKHREVTLLYEPNMYNLCEKFIMIPFKTLASHSFVKGIIVEKMIVDGKYVFEDVLIGLARESFSLDHAEIILHGNFKNKLL